VSYGLGARPDNRPVEATKGRHLRTVLVRAYQGRPAPETGAIWLKECGGATRSHLDTAPDGTFRSRGLRGHPVLDMAFRDTKSSDYVVGQSGPNAVRTATSSTRSTAIELHRDPRCRPAYEVAVPPDQEDHHRGKANGDAVIDSLKHEIPGIVVFEPGRDSKEGRATAVSPYIRAGNVHLPTTRVASMAPEIFFDVEAFIVEATSFPNAATTTRSTRQPVPHRDYRVSGESSILIPSGGSRSPA